MGFLGLVAFRWPRGSPQRGGHKGGSRKGRFENPGLTLTVRGVLPFTNSSIGKLSAIRFKPAATRIGVQFSVPSLARCKVAALATDYNHPTPVGVGGDL